MNVTKEIVTDLFPLYLANECSADSRALVEDYLRANPAQAEELKRMMNTPLPRSAPPTASLEEVRSLREARRRVRRQSVLLGLAIFFSLLPFSFLATGGKIYWLLIESPMSAAIYAALGVGCWVTYFVLRRMSRILSKQ
jgi:ferric-dicitrate binding protein FerR (iron transport regulator)